MTIYTSIVGSVDKPRDDIKVFTSDKFVRPVMNAKMPKILSHQFIHDDISFWVDGNIYLLENPETIVKEFLGDADMAVFKHPFHNTMEEELDGILQRGNEIGYGCQEQYDYYKSQNTIPNKMFECNILIRRHNQKVIEFNNDWWAEICKWSARDQLSFPVVLSRHDIKVNTIIGNVRNHRYFKYVYH